MELPEFQSGVHLYAIAVTSNRKLSFATFEVVDEVHEQIVAGSDEAKMDILRLYAPSLGIPVEEVKAYVIRQISHETIRNVVRSYALYN